jgi:hypothetical protein
MGRNPTYKLITGHRGNIKGISCRIKSAETSRHCFVCDKTFERKLYENGRFETWQRFYIRKTCSKECKKELIKKEGNPKWKGGIPKCILCNTTTSWYASKNVKKANPQKYCYDCYIKKIAIISPLKRKLTINKQ